MQKERALAVGVECYAGHRGEQTPRTLMEIAKKRNPHKCLTTPDDAARCMWRCAIRRHIG